MAATTLQPAKLDKEPKDARETERRAALLYQHALRFDSTEQEGHAILGEALLGGVSSEDVKSTVERVGKDHEILTIKRGRKIIWQSCRALSPNRKRRRPE